MLSWNQMGLLIAPWLLLPTTYLCYQLLGHRWGAKVGYLGGFLFYWAIWCIAFPLAILGTHGFEDLFRSVSSPFGQPWWVGMFCLVAPPLVALVTIFPHAIRSAGWQLVFVSAILAIVNGTLEEVLWRGAYVRLFPDHFWLALIYPTLGFAVWHFAPQSILPHRGRGGQVALVAQVAFLGFLWAWVANNTQTIVWTSLAHILIDFSALGWQILFDQVHQAAPATLGPSPD